MSNPGNNSKVIVIGAGISGLSIAYFLSKQNYDITVYEAGPEPGGTMLSQRKEGFLIDYGPNSGLETTGLIKEIVQDVGIEDLLIYANETAKNRFVLKDNRLMPLPMNPVDFLRTPLFTWKAKLRLLKEPFIGKSKDGYCQSIGDFVIRRLGREFLDYAIDPFVSGVYAGDPFKLSVKSAFPKLYRLEEVYGSLISGMIKGAKERKKRAEVSKPKERLFSFKEGMQTLPKAMAKYLKDRVKFNQRVVSVLPAQGQYSVIIQGESGSSEERAEIVISAVPAYHAAEIFQRLDQGISSALKAIYYPPVMVRYLAYLKKDIGKKQNGFGFLIPSKENKPFLGAIFNSAIFPERVREDCASFSLFIGGARNSEIFNRGTDKALEKAKREFESIMHIKGKPVFQDYKLWPKAIPQYNLGYHEYEEKFADFERKHPGIFLAGNYRSGISIGDCILNSQKLSVSIQQFLTNTKIKGQPNY